MCRANAILICLSSVVIKVAATVTGHEGTPLQQHNLTALSADVWVSMLLHDSVILM